MNKQNQTKPKGLSSLIVGPGGEVQLKPMLVVIRNKGVFAFLRYLFDIENDHMKRAKCNCFVNRSSFEIM